MFADEPHEPCWGLPTPVFNHPPPWHLKPVFTGEVVHRRPRASLRKVIDEKPQSLGTNRRPPGLHLDLGVHLARADAVDVRGGPPGKGPAHGAKRELRDSMGEGS